MASPFREENWLRIFEGKELRNGGSKRLKGLPQQAEVALGLPGKLRPRIS